MIIEVASKLLADPLKILSESREGNLPLMRQLYWKLLREKTTFTYQKIADLSGRKTHATVYIGIKKVNELLEIKDPITVKMWNKIKNIER